MCVTALIGFITFPKTNDSDSFRCGERECNPHPVHHRYFQKCIRIQHIRSHSAQCMRSERHGCVHRYSPKRDDNSLLDSVPENQFRLIRSEPEVLYQAYLNALAIQPLAGRLRPP